jgi:hypothetical protein
MGRSEYELQGVTVERDAWPDTVNMHPFVLEVVEAMSAKDKKRWTALMKSIGREVFATTRVLRPVVMAKDLTDEYRHVVSGRVEQLVVLVHELAAVPRAGSAGPSD